LDAGILKEFLSFIRVRIAVGVSLLTLYGCILYGVPVDQIPIAMLSTFFSIASTYALNNLTDVNEDRINRKRINTFSESKTGLVTTALLGVLGLSTASLLGPLQLLAYLVLTVGLAAYSLLRIKRLLIVKNVYTSLFISFALVAGAASMYSERMPVDFVFMLAYTTIGTIVVDVRDIEGDRASKVFTIPVVFGEGAADALIYAGTVAQIAYLFLFNLSHFFITIPFSVLMLLLLSQRKFEQAHMTGTLALVLMIVYALYARAFV